MLAGLVLFGVAGYLVYKCIEHLNNRVSSAYAVGQLGLTIISQPFSGLRGG